MVADERWTAAMDEVTIGQRVLHEGRVYLVHGVDPMSVLNRRLYLVDAEHGQALTVLAVVLRPVGPEASVSSAAD